MQTQAHTPLGKKNMQIESQLEEMRKSQQKVSELGLHKSEFRNRKEGCLSLKVKRPKIQNEKPIDLFGTEAHCPAARLTTDSIHSSFTFHVQQFLMSVPMSERGNSVVHSIYYLLIFLIIKFMISIMTHRTTFTSRSKAFNQTRTIFSSSNTTSMETIIFR